jgi:hypothetical protein
LTDISLSNLDKGSKLILLGDWYKRPEKGWEVACYFVDDKNKSFTKGMPVDLLPALIPGTVYPRLSVNNLAKGFSGTFKVPAMEEWHKCSYSDLPASLKRVKKYSEQIDNQIIYRFDVGEHTIWLPATELARMLFFHSSEVVRDAVYQGNTWQLAKSDQEGWVGTVTFTSNVPVSYLNSLQFRKFFAWLFFDSDAEESFCSIFKRLNADAFIQDDHERWTFDFQPPDLSSCEISWVGFTGDEDMGQKHHRYVREIRSIAGVRAPELESIMFSHPADILFLEGEPEENNKPGEKPPKQRPKAKPKEIDPDNPPKAGKKRYLIRITSAGFYFDTEIDLRRSPRQVKALPKGKKPQLDEPQEEDTFGITEGSDHGKKPRADIDNLEKPDLVDSPEKIKFFKTMLENLEVEHGWKYETNTGNVPKMRCRSVHLIEGRPRQYCHTVLFRDAESTVEILEIELTNKECLSTLFYRTKNTQETLGCILDELMTSEASKNFKAMQWKRKMNTELTTSHLYLGHPDKKIKNEDEALEAWVAIAAGKVKKL